MARYLRQVGDAYIYQRAVPTALQPLVGLKIWTKYFGTKVSKAEAEQLTRKLATQHDDVIRELGRLNGDARNALMKAGGAGRLQQNADRFMNASRFMFVPGVSDVIDGTAERIEQGLALLEASEAKANSENAASEALRLTEIASKANPKTAIKRDTLLGVIDVWFQAQPRRHHQARAHMERAIKVLVVLVGNKRIVDVTQADVVRLRDHVREAGMSDSMQRATMTYVRTLMSACVDAGMIQANPAAGLKLPKSAATFSEQKRGRPFSAQQVRSILDSLYRLKTRGMTRQRHDSIKWAVRLMAYHGCRPSEVCQLLKSDVQTSNGVTFLDLNDRNGKTIKNLSSVRRIALHPECSGLVDFVATVAGIHALDLKADGGHGRAGWIIGNFRERMLTPLGITDPRLTLYSLRHRFADACRDAGVPGDLLTYLLGHDGGMDARYGSGPGLKIQAEWMEKVDPTRDA